MSAKQEVLQLFTEPFCSVLQLSELRKCYHERMVQSGVSLQKLLQELVESGSLKCRLIPTTANSDHCTIYWLSSDRANATPSRSPSAALRERLKRSRPRFVSPLLSTKRSRVVTCDGPPDTPSGGRLDSQICPVHSQEPPVGRVDPPVARLDFSQCSEDHAKVEAVLPPTEVKVEERRQQLLRQKSSLERQLEQQLERRRKLRMVKLHRMKNDLCQLSTLTDKWRGVAQDTAEQLLTLSSLHPPPSMLQLLSHLHIDPSTIHYSSEEECFY